MSTPDREDLEADELLVRMNDLTEKIERAITEGWHGPATALPALIDAAVSQLFDCEHPEESFRRFLLDLIASFSLALNTPDDEPDD
jgi:hypothetical protein